MHRLDFVHIDEKTLLAPHEQRSDISRDLLEEAESLIRIAALLRLRAEYVTQPKQTRTRSTWADINTLFNLGRHQHVTYTLRTRDQSTVD